MKMRSDTSMKRACVSMGVDPREFARLYRQTWGRSGSADLRLPMRDAVEQARAYGADAEVLRRLRRWKNKAMSESDRAEYRWAMRGSQCSRWMIELALAWGKKPLGVRRRYYSFKMSINEAVRTSYGYGRHRGGE
jgi:hypothetical protein